MSMVVATSECVSDQEMSTSEYAAVDMDTDPTDIITITDIPVTDLTIVRNRIHIVIRMVANQRQAVGGSASGTNQSEKPGKPGFSFYISNATPSDPIIFAFETPLKESVMLR